MRPVLMVADSPPPLPLFDDPPPPVPAIADWGPKPVVPPPPIPDSLPASALAPPDPVAERAAQLVPYATTPEAPVPVPAPLAVPPPSGVSPLPPALSGSARPGSSAGRRSR